MVISATLLDGELLRRKESPEMAAHASPRGLIPRKTLVVIDPFAAPDAVYRAGDVVSGSDPAAPHECVVDGAETWTRQNVGRGLMGDDVARVIERFSR